MIYNDNRPEHIRGAIYLSVVILFFGYQLINAFVQNADMIIATRVLASAVYAAVLFVYGPDAWKALRKPKPKRADFLVVGIVLSFLSHLGQSIYSIVYRLADAPEWLLNAEVVSFIVLTSVVGAIMHISAPGSLDGTVPRKNRIALGAGFGLAVLAIGFLTTTRPDLRPLIDRSKPYISDWWKTGEAPSEPPVPPA